MFRVLRPYSGNGVLLEAREYTKEELVSLYGSENSLNFCLKCTSLKDAVEEVAGEEVALKEKIIKKVEEVIEVVSGEASEEVALKFLVQENIKKGRKILFKEGDKVTEEELEDLDIQELLNEGKLLEIKVV